MRLIYNFGIAFYGLLARVLGALRNKQAQRWVLGRKNTWKQLVAFNPKGKPVIWFHTASAGEFEQGRPVMEACRANYPDHLIALSFFSPSGYEMHQYYAGADIVFYLPEDTAANAKRFQLLLKPKLAVFVKYEFWFHHFHQLKEQAVPLLLVSAPFRPNQPFFKPITAKFWGKMLHCVTHFFVQDQTSAALLASLGFSNSTVAGDTRTDRVQEAAKTTFSDAKLEAFAKAGKLLVAGSTWPADEQLLCEALQINGGLELRVLLVPHTLNERHLQSIMQQPWPQPVARYSEATVAQAAHARVLVLDTMGMLSKAYRFGNLAYVGGGFGKGIHNILEAAVYGIPVFFGPKHRKFNEALALQSAGVGFSVAGAADFYTRVNRLTEDDLSLIRHRARQWFAENQGAAASIMHFIQTAGLIGPA